MEKTDCSYCHNRITLEIPTGGDKGKRADICGHALFENIHSLPAKRAPYLYALCKDKNDGNCPRYSPITWSMIENGK